MDGPKPNRDDIHPGLLALLDAEDAEVELLNDSTDIQALRAEFTANMAAVDGTPPDIAATWDTQMAVEGGSVPLRIYEPRTDTAAPAPIIAFFHGGGFLQGDLDSHDSICRILANEAGAVVVAVHYRRSPEHVFPTAHLDCAAAVDWIRENANALNGDEKKLAVAGDSAGATIAAGLVVSGRITDIAFQMLFYPSTDHFSQSTESHRLFGRGYWLDNVPFFVAKYMPAKDMLVDPMASPAYAWDLSGLPPAYLCTAGFDPLRDEGRAYAQKMQDAGISVVYENYSAMLHGFLNCRGIVEEADQCLSNAARAFQAALGDRT